MNENPGVPRCRGPLKALLQPPLLTVKICAHELPSTLHTLHLSYNVIASHIGKLQQLASTLHTLDLDVQSKYTAFEDGLGLAYSGNSFWPLQL